VANATPTLDFVIIGAPKAGTTSLFEYLRTHPEIHLPKWKETNFFLDPLYARGVEWYLDWVLADAPADATCGEASVRYMAGTPYGERPDRESDGLSSPAEGDGPPELILPTRIYSALPQAKLIAILRDPVERCVSEYGMASLRGEEHRSLMDAVRESLKPAQLERARTIFSTTSCYVVQGEYGRILEPFFRLYPKEQLLVLFTSELADEPGEVVRRVCKFLGVADDFTPPNLGVRYLKGALTPRVRMLDLSRLSRFVKRNRTSRRLWKRLPSSFRQRVWAFSYMLEKWNRAEEQQKTEAGIEAELEATLREHFLVDRERIVALTGREPPWS
jgi:hypothetical protein